MKNALRKQWGLDGKFVVGYAGNIGRAYDFELVLRCAARFKDDPRFVFLFVGDGAQRRALEEECRRENLANVLFKPYQPDGRLAETVAAADCHFISPNPSTDGLLMPSKLYAILAAGRPVIYIGSPEGSVGATIAGEDCGVTVNSGDLAGLIRAVEELRASADRRLKMGERGRRLFERRFDKPIGLERWEKALREAAA